MEGNITKIHSTSCSLALFQKNSDTDKTLLGSVKNVKKDAHEALKLLEAQHKFDNSLSSLDRELSHAETCKPEKFAQLLKSDALPKIRDEIHEGSHLIGAHKCSNQFYPFFYSFCYFYDFFMIFCDFL